MATMVTGIPAAPTPAEPEESRARPGRPARWAAALRARWQLLLVCAGFLVLSLLQAPGKILGDTKSDLVVDPIAFLGRALTLWEPEGAAGQIQNQAYGYLFPMGPFFALGQLAGLPAWIVQRLWFAALMSVAFLGVVMLARRLRIGTPATAVIAGIAYALSPRMVTEIGAISSETIPLALAPWVLVPLVAAEGRGSARRAAALSGLAVFCVGGVNAVATAAVLPLAVLYLLTRPAGPFKRRLIAWWVVAVGLAAAWWAGPLVLLGRFGSSFLYYIETADATTGPTDVLSVLRGTSHWLATLASPSGPNWPAGWALVHEVVPIVGTVLLVAAGLAAMCRRDLPERTWLVLGLLAGVALVSMGHLADVQGVLAERVHDWLDGPLAPFRNVHKWDPVVRLPLVLGLAHLAGVAVRHAQRVREGAEPRHRGRGGAALASRAVLLALVLALVASVSPALAGRLAPPDGFTDVPGYWQETADFLAAQQPSGRALLVPGSSFPQYEWGTPIDEPMQALAESPWDVRNAIPLTPEGHIRMLDAVEARLELGKGSEGLTRYLARAGISHLVLRNDLDTGAAGSTRSVLVREALRESPGISPVASFGPVSAVDDVRDGSVVDAGLDEPAPAVEVYAVADTVPTVWTAPLSSAVTVHGGPEALLPLEDRGVITDRPTLMAGTPGAPLEPAMVSDALLRRERNYGRLIGATSGGLSEDDELRIDNPARDYVLPALGAAESVIEYLGGTPTASSSASDPDGFTAARLDAQPWSAVDGDPLTAWRPAPWNESGEPPWWRLTTERPIAAREIIVSLGQEPGVARPAELRVTTETGELVVPVLDTGDEQTLPLPEGFTSEVTLSALAAADAPGAPAFTLAEVRVPGLNVHRTAVTPPTGPVSVFAFDALRGRSGCVTGAEDAPRCAPGLVSGSEEAVWLDRSFDTGNWFDYEVFATAVARPGPALDALLTEVRQTVEVEASSEPVTDPRGSGAAAVDGNPTTAWMAGGEDRRPTLELTWPEPRTVDSLRVVTDPALAVATPTAVSIDSGGLPRTLPLTEDGSVRFAPVVTDRLSVTFLLPEEAESFDPFTRWEQRLGVGVGELEIGGPNPVADPDTPVVTECGAGPEVRVDGALLLTAVRTTLGRLESQSPLALEFCDAVPTLRLPAGEHRLLARSSDLLSIDTASLRRVGWPDDTDRGVRQAAATTTWESEHRAVEVGARDEPTLLVIPENTNPGWRATLDGQVLGPVAVDGWQQGYVLPPGDAGTVELDFRPGPYYRAALAVGAGAVLLLLLVALLPARPSRERSRHLAHLSRLPRLTPALRAALVPAFVVGAALLGTALVAGLVGLAALAGLWLLRRFLPRIAPAVLGGVAVGGLLVGGALLLVDADGTAGVRQLLAVIALAAVVAGVVPEMPGRWLPVRRGSPGDAVPGR